MAKKENDKVSEKKKSKFALLMGKKVIGWLNVGGLLVVLACGVIAVFFDNIMDFALGLVHTLESRGTMIPLLFLLGLLLFAYFFFILKYRGYKLLYCSGLIVFLILCYILYNNMDRMVDYFFSKVDAGTFTVVLIVAALIFVTVIFIIGLHMTKKEKEKQKSELKSKQNDITKK